MSKFLINILRPSLPFSRSLRFYRKKPISDEDESTEGFSGDEEDKDKSKQMPEEGGGEEGEEGEAFEGIDLSDRSKRYSQRDRRRFRTSNVYVPDFTGEKPLHAWFDQKRFKALGSLYEQIRNSHRFSIKIDPKDKASIGKRTLELTEWQYKSLVEEDYSKRKFKENVENCRKEFQTLPVHLREELEGLHKKRFSRLHAGKTDPFSLFQEQIFRVYPPEMTRRLKFAMRMLRIAADQVPQGE